MFSNLKIVLNGICEAKKRGLKPEVDMENFPTLYNDNDIKIYQKIVGYITSHPFLWG